MRKTQINGRATGSYKMMPFLGPGLRFQACKQNSYSEKDRNQTSGRNIHPTKCGGVANSWLVHTALPFCTENFLLAPIHFVGLLQDRAVYSYK